MMRAARWFLSVAVLGALVACAGEAPQEEPEGATQEAAPVPAEEQMQPGQEAEPAGGTEQRAEPAADRMEGVVGHSGTSEAPMVRLRPAEGSAVTLTGDLLPELTRLAGVTVAVQGTKSGSGLMARFAVTSYEVVSIDGERPVVGMLVRQGDTYRIGDVTLAAVPDGLAQNVGGKVWVTGVREGSTLRVQSFGVIRSP